MLGELIWILVGVLFSFDTMHGVQDGVNFWGLVDFGGFW